MYGLLVFIVGVAAHVAASFCGLVLVAIGRIALLKYLLILFGLGGAALVGGMALALIDLFLLLPLKRRPALAKRENIPNRNLTVVLTAFNDELGIAQAVRDFQAHPLVRRVIVVDNNSKDGTTARARAAGAIVVREMAPGYGKCVYRALTEGIAYPDTDLTLLCEGDMTFRASDIDKFMAYAAHAEIVNGTRIVEQLRERETQLSTFMYYGNFAVGKLLEAKHIGKGTFTDVGTTYKLCRNEALRRLLPLLNSDVNLEFNAHFLDTALHNDFSLLECPITFHKRVGVSKGGNVNNRRAFVVGLRMIRGIVFAW